jgi:hypothetical protein
MIGETFPLACGYFVAAVLRFVDIAAVAGQGPDSAEAKAKALSEDIRLRRVSQRYQERPIC